MKANLIRILVYSLDADSESKWKLTGNIWFLLMNYLSLWDMLSLRDVSKQTFLVVNSYFRFKKYFSFSRQITSTNSWNDFVNQRIKILHQEIIESLPKFDHSFYLYISYVLSWLQKRITIFDCLSRVLFCKRLNDFNSGCSSCFKIIIKHANLKNCISHNLLNTRRPNLILWQKIYLSMQKLNMILYYYWLFYESCDSPADTINVLHKLCLEFVVTLWIIFL